MHVDLVHVLDTILNDHGIAIILAPERGDTRGQFVTCASRLFNITCSSNYDHDVSIAHTRVLNDTGYDENIFYPILMELRRR